MPIKIVISADSYARNALSQRHLGNRHAGLLFDGFNLHEVVWVRRFGNIIWHGPPSLDAEQERDLDRAVLGSNSVRLGLLPNLRIE